jgi:UMF1 family MFS transporter
MINKHKAQIWSWALYDWANSAFSTLILTFVFATYFTSSVMDDTVKAASLWSTSIGISGLCLLFLSPIMGGIADHSKRLKLWIIILMIFMIGGLVMMNVAPHASLDKVYMALCGLIIANIGFELGVVIVNSYLPHIAPAENQGSVSSFGWGMGYIGGIVAMVLTLFGFIGLGDIKPWFELPRLNAEHIRSVLPITGLWMVVFSLPLLIFLPSSLSVQTHKLSFRDYIMTPFQHLIHSIRDDQNWRYFLIGSALYRDGLSTLFAMGGIYAAAKYGMSTQDILIFAIGINITGGIGCFISAKLESKILPFTVIKFSLVGLMICGACVLIAPTSLWFMIFAMILGFFVGPVQSASRTLVSHLSLPEHVGERFGMYALSGRAVAFIGPFLFGFLTHVFQSQTVGLASVLLLWGVGYVIFTRVKVSPT